MGDAQFPARTEREEELALLLRRQAMLYAGAGRGSLPVETVAALLASIRFTLTLGGEEGDILARHHRGQTALRRETERGRMLWQAAWCGAPLEESGTWAETLEELQGLFYCFKNEFPLSDEDLLAAMRAVFDGPAHGALELLPDRLPGYLAGEDAEREVRDD